MNKKILTGFMFCSFLLMTVMTACGTSDNSTEGKQKDADDVSMGITISDIGQDGYITTFVDAIEEEAEKKGVELTVLDAQGDAVKQNNQVENLMQKQVDVIGVWPVNAKSIVPVVKKASENGFKVLNVNSLIDESGFDYIVGYTGPDDFVQGRKAGELMIEALDGEGKVVELTGTPGADNTNLRMEGFREAIKDYDIEIIDSQPANWDLAKGQELMENFLNNYKEIDGVYAVSDNVGVGAYNALKEAGREDEVEITSATMYASGYELIKKGEYYGSVQQSPVEDAKLAIDTVLDIVAGKEIEFNTFIDTPKVTEENVEEFEKPQS